MIRIQVLLVLGVLYKAFFSEPAHHVDGTDRQLGKVETAVNDCVSLREREGAKVEAFLRGTM